MYFKLYTVMLWRLTIVISNLVQRWRRRRRWPGRRWTSSWPLPCTMFRWGSWWRTSSSRTRRRSWRKNTDLWARKRNGNLKQGKFVSIEINRNKTLDFDHRHIRMKKFPNAKWGKNHWHFYGEYEKSKGKRKKIHFKLIKTLFWMLFE